MNVHSLAAGSIAALAMLVTALSLNVSRLRLRHKVSFGDGGHKDLLVAVRAHGNALEQATVFALLMLAAAVLNTLPQRFLTGCCAVFLVARLLHPLALFGRRLALRQVAHVASTLVHLLLALAIVWAVAQGA